MSNRKTVKDKGKILKDKSLTTGLYGSVGWSMIFQRSLRRERIAGGRLDRVLRSLKYKIYTSVRGTKRNRSSSVVVWGRLYCRRTCP